MSFSPVCRQLLRHGAFGLDRTAGALHLLLETVMLKHRRCRGRHRVVIWAFQHRGKFNIHLVAQVINDSLDSRLYYLDSACQTRASVKKYIARMGLIRE